MSWTPNTLRARAKNTFGYYWRRQLTTLTGDTYATIDRWLRGSMPVPVYVETIIDLTSQVQAKVVRPVFGSKTNPSYYKRSKRLYVLADAGKFAELAALPIAGTNTYAKQLRRLRSDLLLAAAARARLAENASNGRGT